VLRTVEPVDRARVESALLHAGCDPGRIDLELRVVDERRATRWVALTGSVLDEGRSVSGATSDVSARKHAEEQIAEVLQREYVARAEAERASLWTDHLVATISHELRTPLSSILGWAQILARRPFDEHRSAEGLAVIEQNARFQARLVEDLLDMSRLRLGKLPLTPEPLDLEAVVVGVVDAVRPLVLAKGLELTVRLDARTTRIRGDADRLRQVFWNLLGNAVKFTERGGRIEVAVERHGGELVARVVDTGLGIPPDFLPRVFDPFRQGAPSTTSGGLGVGLALVKELVELHGGGVHAASDGLGMGSCFEVRLPLATPT
jgi:signal transduction histidine kinase